jgi:hypothetical protein
MYNAKLPFTQERKNKYLTVLQATGEKVLARHEVGVCRATVDVHRKGDPEFRDDEAEAMRLYRSSLSKEIHRRGVEGVDEPIYWQGAIVGWTKKYSDRLLIEHVRRHNPAYRERVRTEHSGSVDLGLTDLSKLDPVSRDLMRQILEREAKSGEQEKEE